MLSNGKIAYHKSNQVAYLSLLEHVAKVTPSMTIPFFPSLSVAELRLPNVVNNLVHEIGG
jgi:hypothetical protein